MQTLSQDKVGLTFLVPYEYFKAVFSLGDIFAESKNILRDSGLRSSFMISRSASVRVLSKRVKNIWRILLFFICDVLAMLGCASCVSCFIDSAGFCLLPD